MRLPIKNKSVAVAYMGILSAVLLALSFLEAVSGINVGIPGARLGLSNSVITLAVMRGKNKAAAMLSVIKIIFSLILTSGVSGFLFTAFGTVASLFVMIFAKKLLKNRATAVGISALGGTAHITMQYLCASFLLKTVFVWGMYPVAAAFSLGASAVTGFICNLILERKVFKWD